MARVAGMRYVLMFWILMTGAAQACEVEQPCLLGDRSYHVKEPDGWDGEARLPVLLHFHGWARTGVVPVRHPRIAGATERRGVLLVAPTGLNKSWDFWRPGSRDTEFARAVLEDVRARYPVDEARIYVSGYSWGSNMAWRFVCEDGADIAALLAISGVLDQDENCETAPGQVRQVYGLNDPVLEFPYGPDGETGNVVRLWRGVYGCGEGRELGPWQAVKWLILERVVWEDCPGGRVSLDLHPGGHFIPHGWVARQLDELLGFPPSYP